MKKLTKKLIGNKLLWALVFVLAAGLVGKIGYDRYNADKLAAELQSKSNVTRLTMQNAEQVFSAGTPVFVHICISDICDMQMAELEKAAAVFKGKVTFALVDFKAQGALAGALYQLVVTTAGQEIPVAFPMHIYISAEGKPLGFFQGIVDAGMLVRFIGSALRADASMSDPSAANPVDENQPSQKSEGASESEAPKPADSRR